MCKNTAALATMSMRTFKTALVTRGHTAALRDRRVTPRGFAFDFEDVPVIINAFRRMVRSLDFDISEMAMTTYLCARAHGKPFTAIPVFPMRALHHGAVLVNCDAGIREPKDLEGQRVGVNRGYTVTTGVWARGILQHQYGVDLRRITWVLSGDEHVAEYRPPRNVVPLEGARSMEDLLVSGEIPAAIGVKVESPRVQPLIANADDAAFEALRRTGLYPINHTVVVKDEVLAAHPDLAVDLFEAFAAAKRAYLPALAPGASDPLSAEDRFLQRVQQIIGDPLPYGINANRRMLEWIIRHAVEQDIIPETVAPETLFAPATHRLG